MPDDDYQEFQRAMEGVAPLGKRSRAHHAPYSGRGSSVRPQEAAVHVDSVAVPDVAPIAASAVLAYRKPGLRDGDYQKLCTGKLRPPPIEHDLHGMTLSEACTETHRAIAQSQHAGLRSLCLVHGKGSTTGSSRMKGAVDALLRTHPEVLGFHSVPRNTGAVNVLLRRSRT